MSENISIVQVMYSLNLCGSESVGRDIARGLDHRGYKFTACSINMGGPIESDLLSLNIPYEIINRNPKRRILTMWKVCKLLQKTKPNIVHTHHLGQLFYSVIGAKLCGAKIIHTEHSNIGISDMKNRLLLKVLSKFCEYVTSVSDDVRDFLYRKAGIPDKKLLVIYNGVDLTRFNPAVVLPKTALGFKETDKIIGIVGSLIEVKDHLTLLAAFHEIQKTEANVKLLIVGDGDGRESLIQESRRLGIHDNVRFLGVRKDIPQLLSAMDVFVLCSISEGMPLALLEAMAMERPVVATSVGSIPSVLKNKINGLLVGPKKPMELAAAIRSILNDSTFGSNLGKAALNTVKERFDFKNTLEKYDRLYKKILRTDR